MGWGSASAWGGSGPWVSPAGFSSSFQPVQQREFPPGCAPGCGGPLTFAPHSLGEREMTLGFLSRAWLLNHKLSTLLTRGPKEPKNNSQILVSSYVFLLVFFFFWTLWKQIANMKSVGWVSLGSKVPWRVLSSPCSCSSQFLLGRFSLHLVNILHIFCFNLTQGHRPCSVSLWAEKRWLCNNKVEIPHTLLPSQPYLFPFAWQGCLLSFWTKFMCSKRWRRCHLRQGCHSYPRDACSRRCADRTWVYSSRECWSLQRSPLNILYQLGSLLPWPCR